MLCSIYIEALVWEAWNAGELCDVAATMAWLSMLRMSASEH